MWNLVGSGEIWREYETEVCQLPEKHIMNEVRFRGDDNHLSCPEWIGVLLEEGAGRGGREGGRRGNLTRSYYMSPYLTRSHQILPDMMG